MGVPPLSGEDLLLVGEGDEQAPGTDVDPVDEDLVVSGFDGSGGGLDVPAPGSVSAEGAGATGEGEFGQREFAEKSDQEVVELVAAGEVFAFSDG